MKVFTRSSSPALMQWCKSLTSPLEHVVVNGFTPGAPWNIDNRDYFMRVLQDESDWVCNMDDDAFLVSVDRLIKLKTHMQANGYGYCGMRDGGTCPVRAHNPSVIASFFGVFDLTQIRSRLSSYRPEDWQNPEVCRHLEPDRFRCQHKWDMIEVFYPLFLWLRSNFKCLFLDSFQSCDPGPVWATGLNDHNEKPLVIHTWFGREFTSKNTRYKAVFDRTRQLRLSSD